LGVCVEGALEAGGAMPKTANTKDRSQAHGRAVNRTVCQPETWNALHILLLLHPAVTTRHQPYLFPRRCSEWDHREILGPMRP